MSLFRLEWAKKSGWPALVFLAAGLLTTLNALERVDPQVDTTERKVRDLAKQFAEILTPTKLEAELRTKCAVDCSAVEDHVKELTVAQESEDIEKRHRVEMSRVGAEIQIAVNGYVVNSPAQAMGQLIGSR